MGNCKVGGAVTVQSPEDAETPDLWSREYRPAQGSACRGIMVEKLHQL
jgi:hypothetical protein